MVKAKASAADIAADLKASMNSSEKKSSCHPPRRVYPEIKTWLHRNDVPDYADGKAQA